MRETVPLIELSRIRRADETRLPDFSDFSSTPTAHGIPATDPHSGQMCRQELVLKRDSTGPVDPGLAAPTNRPQTWL
jgi:hypothetical protein